MGSDMVKCGHFIYLLRYFQNASAVVVLATEYCIHRWKTCSHVTNSLCSSADYWEVCCLDIDCDQHAQVIFVSQCKNSGLFLYHFLFGKSC